MTPTTYRNFDLLLTRAGARTTRPGQTLVNRATEI